MPAAMPDGGPPAAQDSPRELPQLTAPSLSRRMACWLYEGMLLFAVVFFAGWLFSTLGQLREAGDPRRPLLQAFLFVVFGVYFAWFWAKGQTLAMKTWKIRVVDRRGAPLTQGRAFVRYLFSWLWFLPALAVLAMLKLGAVADLLCLSAWVVTWAMLSFAHPQRQFWHDEFAGTRLVQA